jgi:hypothetical protein
LKQIKVEGFTSDTTPDNKPAVCVMGEENVGKSRFGCSVPADNGIIGWIAVDKNSKSTVDKYREEFGLQVVVNQKPFLTHQEAIKVALNDAPAEAKSIYKGVMDRVFTQTMALAAHPDIESIVIDGFNQIYDWILFSHFGRRNQIESFLRAAPNQDAIDLVNALGNKNLCLITRSQEVWKDTGEVDKEGRKKQAPSGKFKPEGFAKIGGLVTAVVELTAKRGKLLGDDDEEKLADKYRCRIQTCKGQVLLEGTDIAEYGVCGSQITWNNLMQVIGISE